MADPVIADLPTVMRTTRWADYALKDSGEGKKLERYGPLLAVRPEPQCLWRQRNPDGWAAADAVFDPHGEEDEGRWRYAKPIPDRFPLSWNEVKFFGRFTPFRHLGFFPEQAANWAFLRERLDGGGPRFLNLFGYTGVASLVAAQAGASVTHLDASKKSVAWARENAELSGLTDAPIRWIVEDARKYVRREIKRGSKYDGIILDPPKYGRGPEGDVWRLFEDLPPLLANCAELLSDDARFMVLNVYAERISGLAVAGLMAQALAGRGGRIEWGELALMEESSDRGIGLSFFARWTP
ncbi:MAG: class I SAM-dependent methyltransferase [Caulobacteraceae bacterium]